VRHTKDPEIDEQVRLFGENMRTARLAAGLSQVLLSEATRLDRAAISFLERAERAPDLSTLVRVARALDSTPAELLDGVGFNSAQALDSAPVRERPASGEVPAADPGLRFGANLRAARNAAGFSQEALAYEADVDRAAISVYERGRREPNLRTILKLARALRLSPADALEGVQ
jgi:transcriptional regulator with XRE-family HTH domain